MAKPLPQNWNQDLVFAMPERGGFGGCEGSAEEWAIGYGGVKDMMQSEAVLRRKSLLEEVSAVGMVGLGVVRVMGLWGRFGGRGDRERRMAMRE